MVTGASRGIGRAIALTLATDGFNIFVNYRSSKEKAEEVASEIKALGREAYLIQADVTKQSDVVGMFAELKKVTEELNVLVNSAGFDYGYTIEEYTMEQMRYVIDSVLLSKIAVTKSALPFLKNAPYPSIINIASRMGGPKTIAGVAPYAAGEAGVIKFTQCCALEFKDYRIRVNCIAPGLTDTDLNRIQMKLDQNFLDAAAKSNPSGRIGRPQDIANVVSFLVSEKASYINGETIGVNGGSVLV